jgi:hypothetical protein
MRLGLLLVAAAALAGCTTGPPTVGEPVPVLADKAQEQAYRAVLERYSAQAQIYRQLDTYLFTGGTFQSWAFREARVRRDAAFKHMTQAEIDAALARERAEHETHNDFIFGIWVVDPAFDDFDRKGSMWRVALVLDDGEVLPVSVTRVARVTQDVRAIYPYMGQFWVKYRARFPKTRADGTPVIRPGTQQVKLVLASSVGRAELSAAAE